LLRAVFDGALVGALGLEREVAFGVAHRQVGRPDVAGALELRRAGGELDRAACAWADGVRFIAVATG
jgi:hypothetical protein